MFFISSCSYYVKNSCMYFHQKNWCMVVWFLVFWVLGFCCFDLLCFFIAVFLISLWNQSNAGFLESIWKDSSHFFLEYFKRNCCSFSHTDLVELSNEVSRSWDFLYFKTWLLIQFYYSLSVCSGFLCLHN